MQSLIIGAVRLRAVHNRIELDAGRAQDLIVVHNIGELCAEVPRDVICPVPAAVDADVFWKRPFCLYEIERAEQCQKRGKTKGYEMHFRRAVNVEDSNGGLTILSDHQNQRNISVDLRAAT